MLILCIGQAVKAQVVFIRGIIQSEVNIENIHVINTTSQKFTVTDNQGSFTIPVRLNDTLKFSSIQHQTKEVVISKSIADAKLLTVVLKEQITSLDEVLVGKVLSGDLNTDIGNVEGKPPINFYDLGIPGYTGKPATQSERRLAEAGELKPKMLLGALTGSIPLNPIINSITGRTKMLKKRVAHEKSDALLTKIRERFSKDLFSENPLDEDFKMDFFYFCEMDERFMEIGNSVSNLEVFQFLREKLKQYKANQKGDK